MAEDCLIEKFVDTLLKNLDIIREVKRESKTRSDKLEEVNKKVEIAKDAVSSLVEILQGRLDCIEEGESEISTAVRDQKREKTIQNLKELFDAEVGESSKKKNGAGDEDSSRTIYKTNEKNKIPYSFDDCIMRNNPEKTKILYSFVDESIMRNNPEKIKIPYSFVDESIMRNNPELAICCYSLSVFPQNIQVRKRSIIYWWIGLGLLPTGMITGSAEDTGEIFFNDLVSIGVIKPETLRCKGDVDGCIIELTAHEQLKKIAKRRKIFKIFPKGGGGIQLITFRHKVHGWKALVNFDEKVLKSDDLIKLLAKTNELAALQLGLLSLKPHHIEVDKTDFLEKLESSLTFLGLRGISRITKLPESIGNLDGLVVLNLRACHNLEKLPPKIKSMDKLTHLDVSRCYLLDHMPSWVGTLANLEVLKGFVIGSSTNKNICRLSDLSQLKKLRKLTMTIRRTSVVKVGEVESLKDLRNLRSLTITWGKNTCDNTKERCYPQGLEKLDFRCYPQKKMPEWFIPEKLKSLKRLYIRGGKLERFKKEGNANSNEGWNVEILRLRFLTEFMMPRHEVGQLFTKLELMECVNCKNMTAFETDDGCWRKERNGPLRDDKKALPTGSGISSDGPSGTGDSNKDEQLPSRPGLKKRAINWTLQKKKVAGRKLVALGEFLKK